MIPSTTLHLDAAQALVSLQTVPKEQQEQQNVRQNFFAASNKFPEIVSRMYYHFSDLYRRLVVPNIQTYI